MRSSKIKVTRHSPRNSFRAAPQIFGDLQQGLSVLALWGQGISGEDLHTRLWQSESQQSLREETVALVSTIQEATSLQQMSRALRKANQYLKNDLNSKQLQGVAEVFLMLEKQGILYCVGCGDFVFLLQRGKKIENLILFPRRSSWNPALPQHFLGGADEIQLQEAQCHLVSSQVQVARWVLYSGFPRPDLVTSVPPAHWSNPLAGLPQTTSLLADPEVSALLTNQAWWSVSDNWEP